MKLLFVGDVIGKPGRRVLKRLLPGLIDRHRVDYTVVNVENMAGGFGVTASVLDDIGDLPIDCMTTGNHIWDKKEGLPLLDEEPRLLRPANYPEGNPGRGIYVGETAAGVPQLQAIREAYCAVDGEVPIIADGGVSDDKDIFLALVCGASSVMLGSALSGTDESPGHLIEAPATHQKR